MNFRNMIAELVEIQRHPNATAVTIDVEGPTTTYTFINDAYYFPAGIARISIERGGAGVVYVYTTTGKYPHLTIPDDGINVHWTESVGKRSSQWPEPLEKFLRLFP